MSLPSMTVPAVRMTKGPVYGVNVVPAGTPVLVSSAYPHRCGERAQPTAGDPPPASVAGGGAPSGSAPASSAAPPSRGRRFRIADSSTLDESSSPTVALQATPPAKSEATTEHQTMREVS